MKATICVAIFLIGVVIVPNEAAKSGGKGKKPDLGAYKEAADTVAKHVGEATKKSEELQNEHMKNVEKDPGSLITRESMKNFMTGNVFLPQKAGTRTINVEANQGFNGITNYQPSGWKVTETMSGPTDSKKEESDEKESTVGYPFGVGPVLFNQCTERNYSKTSPCYNSKLFDLQNSICLNMMDAAGYIGVGFDGRGYYKSESRKTSLVQRVCANKATFMDQDVPDTMNVFGIFETTAETRSFQSVDQYMRYIRHKAGLSNQKNLFKSEANKYSKAKSFGANLGGIGAIVGGAIGAVAGGPVGAGLGASLGGAIGGSIGGGSGRGSGSSSSKTNGKSDSKVEQTDKSSRQEGATQNFFAMMHINVILYEITLDELKPTDISLAALKSYMALPRSYYSIGSDVKYQNFLLRWGTHFIRSGKFGGQLKITKTSRSHKSMTSDQFASVAETEFQSMFSTLQSKYTQKSSSWGFLGIGGKSKSTSQKSTAKEGAEYKGTSKQEQKAAQRAKQSEFTQTTVEAQGGTPEIAEALVDFYTPAFKQLYHDWLVSIKDYAKPFEFQLKAINELFNMNMNDLFPAGNLDFGCVSGAKGKVKVLVEPKTNKRYYIDTRSVYINNKVVEEKIRVYCKFHSLKDFEKDLDGRRISLEKAVAVYMAEGPFPTSSFQLSGGQPGCEEATLSVLQAASKGSEIMKFADLHKAPFLLVLDLPQPIPEIASMQGKYRMIFRGGMWFATDPKATTMHLFDGCQLGGYSPKDTKICFKNIILTYTESNGFFHIDPKDFVASKQRIPTLPLWLSGSTVARAKKINQVKEIHNNVKSGKVSVPCNVKWLNSHRLDPSREQNCIHFTAATKGDIFVVFASIPRKHKTWYYLQITPDGVSFYQAMQLHKSDTDDDLGLLGDKNLYQSFFVCLTQKDSKVTMQYGKADPDSEIGTVHASHTFPSRGRSRLSFYSFGSGINPVSLMDIRLTTVLPKVKCLRNDYVKKDGQCVLKCHSECKECVKANSNAACQQCKNMRADYGSGSSKHFKCLATCPAGYSKSRTRKNFCEPCRSGYYKSGAGNHQCVRCPAGTFSTVGSSKCTRCATGTWSNKAGQTECEKCKAGTYASTEDGKGCVKCAAGMYSKEGQTKCTRCPVGHYGSSSGLGKCTACSAGYYAPAEGLRRCTKCPSGSSSAAGSSSCKNSCRRGQFSPRRGVPCSNCRPGTISKSAGSSSCTKCPAGTYQPREGQYRCLSAPAGTYAPSAGLASVTRCPGGRYNSRAGQRSSSACFTCRAGTYSRPGSRSCTNCPRNTVAITSGRSSCTRCSSGYYYVKSTQCKKCPLYSYTRTSVGCPRPTRRYVTATLFPRGYTNWGSWGGWQYCPVGFFVNRFQLRVERSQGSGDDSALNSIYMYCSRWAGRYESSRISSRQGYWGSWKSIKTCTQFFTAINMRSEPRRGSGDDTGANDLMMRCGHGSQWYSGGGQGWGRWVGAKYCPSGSAICAIRTQVESKRGSGDDSALNNVQVKCCKQ